MQEAAYGRGDQITYTDKNGIAQTGTIEQGIEWPPSFAYWVKGQPHKWIQEETIQGYKERRDAKKK